MRVYLVASALPNWMRTGYGHSLLAAEHPSILVSFAEYLKLTDVERLTLRVEPMGNYVPVERIEVGSQDSAAVGAKVIPRPQSLTDLRYNAAVMNENTRNHTP